MKRVFIFFALKGEANQFLHHCGVRFTRQSYNHFVSDHSGMSIEAFITGFGRDQVYKFFTENKLKSCDLAVKCGIVGVVDKNIPLLQPFVPKFISYKKDKIETSLIDSLDRLRIDSGLATLDEIFSRESSTNTDNLLRQNIKFVDMETFHIYSCYHQKILPIVVGTDYGNTPVQMVKKNIKTASVVLKGALLSLFDGIS